jgi:CheY-like chemotaxis protein/two-component sensor histidine kinase
MELHVEDFQVEELVRDIATLTQPLVEKNSNRFEVEVGDALGEMRSDVTKIRQAVMNLISNAGKFTENGVVTLRAERVHREDGDWITLVVSDNGTGIPADKFDHVFEEFAQASSTRARDYGGTGLGLPLTRRFSRLLGGDVHLDSQLGSGSTFTIELPAVLTDAHGHLPGDEAPVVDSDSGIRSPNVLVIDDEPHARELLLRGLEREGYSVTTAADGATGIELARKLRPALITLDIIMPTMDGWAVLAALKADAETRDIPVAMVSIAPDDDLGIILGAVESLQKPIDRDALTSLVSRYVLSEESRLLIVDDDETSRAVTRRYGEAAGWKCDEAENGAVALERIAACRPDLILLDLMMPVMNGFEMLDELRSRSEYLSIPVIVLTARTLTDEDRRRLNGNVERIIEKGHHSTEDVLAYVRNVLSGPSEKDRQGQAS